MDFQDILFLLIFLGISFLSKKTKMSPLDEETDDQAELVRKKIEALKRKRSGTDLDEAHTHVEAIEPNPFWETKRKEFSAYKHPLPVYEQPVYECEPQVIEKQPILPKIKPSKPKCAPSTLREGMKWHIILSKPVCTRSFYGNFTNR